MTVEQVMPLTEGEAQELLTAVYIAARESYMDQPMLDAALKLKMLHHLDSDGKTERGLRDMLWVPSPVAQAVMNERAADR